MEQLETGIIARGLFQSEGISVSGSSRRSIALRKFGYTDHDIDRIRAPIFMFWPAGCDANALALSVLAGTTAAHSIMKFDGDV